LLFFYVNIFYLPFLYHIFHFGQKIGQILTLLDRHFGPRFSRIGFCIISLNL